MRVAGIMSGTSLDGIDVAVLDLHGHHVHTVAFGTTPYPAAVRKALLGVSNCVTHTRDIARLHFLLPELYAKAVAALKVPHIDLVGCHGQTIYHESGRATLQIGDGSVLAERLGVPVISDFRPRDIAAGGKGAPLVPYVDYRLFRHRRRGRVALNLGGIGNITAIPPAAKPEQVIAFDTGPGNMVIDQLVERHSNGRQRFDRNGRLAAKGVVNQPLLHKLLRDPFFRLQPPKSAGREQFGAEFVDKLIASGQPPLDLIATATAFTAAAVAEGIRRFVAPHMRADDLIVSGGGAHNPQLMAYLAAFLPGAKVSTSADFGVDIDAKEAIAFAILAYETWEDHPCNLPSATGARHAVLLGKLSP